MDRPVFQMGPAKIFIKGKGAVKVVFVSSFPDPVVGRKAGEEVINCLFIVHSYWG